MKLCKRLVALGCSAALLISIAFPASAAENSNVESDVTVMNEHVQEILSADSTYEGFMANDEFLSPDEIASLPNYSSFYEFDKLEDMKSMSASQLYAKGMTKNEVEKFQSTTVKEMVLDNANETLTDERLREKGLEDNTIQAIREGDYDEVSEAEARRASAVLKLGTGEWAHAGSSANCCIYWHWEDKPLNLWTDTVSSSITNGFDVTANSTCKVGYGDLNSMSSDQDVRFDLVPSTEEDPIPNHIARFDFPMVNFSTKWAIAGKAFVAHNGPSPSGVPIRFTANYYHMWYPFDIHFDPFGIMILDPDEGAHYSVSGTYY